MLVTMAGILFPGPLKNSRIEKRLVLQHRTGISARFRKKSIFLEINRDPAGINKNFSYQFTRQGEEYRLVGFEYAEGDSNTKQLDKPHQNHFSHVAIVSKKTGEGPLRKKREENPFRFKESKKWLLEEFNEPAYLRWVNGQRQVWK